jgi:hypothetical protein
MFARKTRVKRKSELQALKLRAAELIRENEILLSQLCGDQLAQDVARAREFVAYLQTCGINAWVEDARCASPSTCTSVATSTT